MFPYLFTSLRTRCSPHIRGMGYVAETLAMRERSKKRRSAWEPHLEKSRAFVMAAAKRCRNRNKVVILGSGLLLDLPLAELASLFGEVVLLDVVCLPEIEKKISACKNAWFREFDVSNVIEQLYRNRQYGIHELPDPNVVRASGSTDANLVVSLNILSQLAIVPRMYAAREMPGMADESLDDWCRQIVASHYTFLTSLPGMVCLISDYAFVKRDREGTPFSSSSTVYGLELPHPDQCWTWDIEPILKKDQFHSKELAVGAWFFPSGG